MCAAMSSAPAARGIVIGTSGARVSANSISFSDQGTGNDAIVLTTGMDTTGIDQCHVIANRVTNAAGIGIVDAKPLSSRR